MAAEPTGRQIVIIGGGIIGASTAYYLTRHPSFDSARDSITVLEGSSIAAGASGKAGGLLALDWHGPSTSSLAALSYRLHAELAQEHGGAERWGYRALDTLSVSAYLGGSKGRKLGKEREVFDWLDKGVLAESSVIGTKESTAQVHPYLFTTSLIALVQERGVKIVYATATSLARTSSGSFVLSATCRDSHAHLSLRATTVVLGAGPWTGSLAKQLLGSTSLGRAGQIGGSRAHSVVLRPGCERTLPAQAIFTSIKTSKSWSEPEIYVRPSPPPSAFSEPPQNRPDGTAYCCGPTDSSPLPARASLVTTSAPAIAELLSLVGALSPSHLRVGFVGGEEGARIEKEQACYLPVGSGDPVLGCLEEGVYVGSGHSCWGITMGPGTGKCLAELILNGKVVSADVGALGPT